MQQRLTGSVLGVRALALLREHPDLSGLQALDTVVGDVAGTSPSFELSPPAIGLAGIAYGDDLDPPSPFAKLVAEAFGHFTPAEWTALVSASAIDPDARSCAAQGLLDRWDKAIERFARRYELWS